MIPDLAGLLGALAEARLRFIVIGGIAVAAHAVIRSTEDLDIVPEPSPANLDELCNLLVAVDARLLNDHNREIDPEIRVALRRGRNLTVTTTLGDLDVSSAYRVFPRTQSLHSRAGRRSSSGPASASAPSDT